MPEHIPGYWFLHLGLEAKMPWSSPFTGLEAF